MTDSTAKPTSTKDAWSDVGEKLNGLGLKLRLHLEQAKDTEQEAEMRDALKHLRDSVDDTFAAMRNTAKDDAVKSDLLDVGNAFGEALNTTFSEAGDELKKVFAKVEDRREGRAD